MCWILQNSSGREVETGQTFLSTFLYLRTRMVRSADRSGGTEHGLGTCSGRGGVCRVASLWTEIILMKGA